MSAEVEQINTPLGGPMKLAIWVYVILWRVLLVNNFECALPAAFCDRDKPPRECTMFPWHCQHPSVECEEAASFAYWTVYDEKYAAEVEVAKEGELPILWHDEFEQWLICYHWFGPGMEYCQGKPECEAEFMAKVHDYEDRAGWKRGAKWPP